MSAGPRRPTAGDSDPSGSSAPALAEQVARTSYGRLLAILSASTGDIELAEDCLGDAFAKALRTWPETGTPNNPEAWLLTTARNRQRDVHRSAATRTSTPLDDAVASLATTAEFDPDALPDRRLALLFVCAHPAIDAAVRAPLMLQTVLGFEAREIARAYAVPAATMAQRLVRAKRRIRIARIPFVVPERPHLRPRLESVLDALYGAYAIDWLLVWSTTTRATLAPEAQYLAATLAELLGDEPEAFGLAALLSLSLARAPARGSEDSYVPLEEQDTRLWDRELIAQGEGYLRRACDLERAGRYQLEAAIQSVHCARATTGGTDWGALRTLYSALVSIAPTLGARVALASALGRVDGPEAGLAALDEIADPAIQRFQPAWATRAHLLAETGRYDEALSAYERAISLTTEGGLRAFLDRRRQQLEQSSRTRR